MPVTSVMALFGPVRPGNGIPKSRPRGRVCAGLGTTVANAIRTAMTTRLELFLSNFQSGMVARFRKSVSALQVLAKTEPVPITILDLKVAATVKLVARVTHNSHVL